jgi:hypothetical protein
LSTCGRSRDKYGCNEGEERERFQGTSLRQPDFPRTGFLALRMTSRDDTCLFG